MAVNKKLSPQQVEQYIASSKHILASFDKFKKIKKIALNSFFFLIILPTIATLANITLNKPQFEGHEIFISLPFLMATIFIALPLSTIFDDVSDKMNSITSKFKSAKNIGLELQKFFQNPDNIQTFSLLAHYYDTKEEADEYRLELFDFLNNIKNIPQHKLSNQDISFFIEQDNFLYELYSDIKAENSAKEKIAFIKNFENKKTTEKEEFNFINQN